MAMTSQDLVVLLVAFIQKYGILDTLQIEGKWLDEAVHRITTGDSEVTIKVVGDLQADALNITALFTDAQRAEWDRLGMGEGET